MLWYGLPTVCLERQLVADGLRNLLPMVLPTRVLHILTYVVPIYRELPFGGSIYLLTMFDPFNFKMP